MQYEGHKGSPLTHKMATPSTNQDQSPNPKQTTSAGICTDREDHAEAMASTPDPELDAILDSALADFEKVDETSKTAELSAPPCSSQLGKDGHQSEEPVAADLNDGGPDDMNYDFLADAMTKQFEECFGSLMKDPKLKKQFEDLSKSAEQAATTNNPTDFAETVEKALNGLSLNAENLQGDPNQQELWEQLAETLGTESASGGVGGEAGGLPSALGDLGGMGGMFQNMVQQLLSKELLYQPLKDVSEKEYLNENKTTLDPDLYETYGKQLEVIEKVVEHLDQDSDSHSAEEKNARFEVLLDLLQRMHELGNPPQEVVGDTNMLMPNFADLAGMGAIPGTMGNKSPDPSQCNLM